MSIRITSIKNVVKSLTPSDVVSAANKMTEAVKVGRKNGRIPDGGRLTNAKSQTKSIIKEVRNLKFSKEEYPALAAAIVALIPVPSPVPISPIVYGIGKSIQKLIKFFN